MFHQFNPNKINTYLIQRCTSKKLDTDRKKATVSEALSLDYMGSSEFEWGAIPHSFICWSLAITNTELVEFDVVVNVSDRFRSDRNRVGNVRVYGICPKSEENNITEYITKLVNEEARLKERVGFTSADHDFWFSLETPLCFSVKQHLVKDWVHNVVQSVNTMRETWDKDNFESTLNKCRRCFGLKEVDIKKNEDTEEETNHTHPAVLAPAQAAKEATKLPDPAVLALAQAVEEATKLRDRMKSNMHKVDSSTAYTIKQILKDPLPSNINGLTKYIKRANKILRGIL